MRIPSVKPNDLAAVNDGKPFNASLSPAKSLERR